MLLTHHLRQCAQAFMVSAALLSTSVACNAQSDIQTASGIQINRHDLGRKLKIGDVVFIRIPSQPFTEVANSTSSWANHVGIVSDVSGEEPVISESRVPVSGETTWTGFVKRSDAGRVAITRLPTQLNAQQQSKLKQAVEARRGIFYDTGFDLHSQHRQFCSRYVREILNEAAGVELGEIENFSTLLKRNPQADQRFWQTWYFGNIPWLRDTVTPASILRDNRMQVVFDGRVQ